LSLIGYDLYYTILVGVAPQIKQLETIAKYVIEITDQGEKNGYFWAVPGIKA